MTGDCQIGSNLDMWFWRLFLASTGFCLLVLVKTDTHPHPSRPHASASIPSLSYTIAGWAVLSQWLRCEMRSTVSSCFFVLTCTKSPRQGRESLQTEIIPPPMSSFSFSLPHPRPPTFILSFIVLTQKQVLIDNREATGDPNGFTHEAPPVSFMQSHTNLSRDNHFTSA